MAQHIATLKSYYTVFASLLVLTGVTVWVAFMDLGVLNNVLALSIAVAKALLVILFFMHVRQNSQLTKLFVGVGFLWLVIMISFTLGDIFTRDRLPVPQGWQQTEAVVTISSPSSHP